MTTAVLVVDDDAVVRDILCDVLREEGYAVDGAPDGVAAIAVLRASQQRRVVLLDLRMPGLDGRQLLDAVAADHELAQRHAYILLSASVDVHHLAPQMSQLMAERIVGVIDKPFDLDVLLALVEEAARRVT